jgi:hypothetical protein
MENINVWYAKIEGGDFQKFFQELIGEEGIIGEEGVEFPQQYQEIEEMYNH